MNEDLAIKWDIIHRKYCSYYDNFLDKYTQLLEQLKNKPAIELGCGRGYNSKKLFELGFSDITISDFSTVALEYAKNNIPQVRSLLFDMTKTFPLDNDSFSLIIADLCLHYFDTKTTQFVLGEIKRILINGGYIIGRVNSTKDINQGKKDMIEIEENYYYIDNMYKRYFNEQTLKEAFNHFQLVDLFEETMDRYDNKKTTWNFVYKK